MQIEANDEFGWFFGALPVLLLMGGIGYFLMQPAPRPAPSYSKVLGCYTASDSPPILLNPAGMHVRQEGFPVIPFDIEKSKMGIALTAGAPIRADKTADGYRFDPKQR